MALPNVSAFTQHLHPSLYKGSITHYFWIASVSAFKRIVFNMDQRKVEYLAHTSWLWLILSCSMAFAPYKIHWITMTCFFSVMHRFQITRFNSIRPKKLIIRLLRTMTHYFKAIPFEKLVEGVCNVNFSTLFFGPPGSIFMGGGGGGD